MQDDTIIQLEANVLAELPTEELLDFDPFLVGDGSAKLIKRRTSHVSSVNQLMGTDSLKDRLTKNQKVKLFQYKKDIASDYKFDDLQEVDDVYAFFRQVKNEIFEKYGYFQKKSEMAGNIPLYVDDLVITSKNHHFLEYLKAKNIKIDKRDLRSLATLFAFHDMRVTSVRFVNKCFCPLCDVYDASILSVDTLLDRLMVDFYVHPYCDCDFLPIFTSDSIISSRYKDVNINNLLCLNTPVEQQDDLIHLINKHKDDVFNFSVINFVNINDFFEKNDVLPEKNVIIYLLSDILYVHNEYIYGYSPVAMLDEYLTSAEQNHRVDDLLGNGTIVYIQGVKAIELDGQYYDYTTKELLLDASLT